MNGKKKAPYRLCHLTVLVGWRNERLKHFIDCVCCVGRVEK